MTKESILDEHVKYAWECDQASPVIPYSEAEKAMDEWAGHLISNSSSITTTLQIPKHILDAYASKQAIAFMQWNSHMYTEGIDRQAGKWFNHKGECVAMSTEELYGQFVASQNNPESLYYIDNQFIEQQNKS